MAEVIAPRIGSFVAGRSAPVGMFWASRGDMPGVGYAVSREWALDHGVEGLERYPSWVKYPDERDLPVGVEARRRWKEREVRILASKAEVSVTGLSVTADSVTRCEQCGNVFEAVRKTARYCSDSCRVKASRAKLK